MIGCGDRGDGGGGVHSNVGAGDYDYLPGEVWELRGVETGHFRGGSLVNIVVMAVVVCG